MTFSVSAQHTNSVFTSKADEVVKDKGFLSFLRLFPKKFFWEGCRQEGASRVSSQDLPCSHSSGSVARHGSEEPRAAGAGEHTRNPGRGERAGNGGCSLTTDGWHRAGGPRSSATERAAEGCSDASLRWISPKAERGIPTDGISHLFLRAPLSSCSHWALAEARLSGGNDVRRC